MVKLLLVNNNDTSHRERAMTLKASLIKNGAEVEMIQWLEVSSSKFQDYDAVVLSGSYDMLSEVRTQVKFRNEIEAVTDASLPLLGICFGHQLLGHTFGSRVVETARPANGYNDAELLKKSGIFEDLPTTIGVYESHHEVLDSLPGGFTHLARSPTAEICAMKHSSFPLYGVQFHPERNSLEKPDGGVVVENFVRNVASG